MNLSLTSLQNPQVKSLIRLRDKKERIKTGTFLIEGKRELERAIACEFEILAVYICPQIVTDSERLQSIDTAIVEITPSIFEKIAVRDSGDGMFAVAVAKQWDWIDLLPSKKPPLLVVCDGVEKPGNLGALLRTMDAVGATGLVTLGQGSDPYNPNAIRASMGAAFSMPHRHATFEEIVSICRGHEITMVAAALSPGAKSLYDQRLNGPLAICLGTEAHGIGEDLLDEVDSVIQIPMTGIVDSLNVSVSGAVILYEVLRQRLQCR